MREVIDEVWIEEWANEYPLEEDAEVTALAGRKPTLEGVRTIVRWKSARSLGYFARNNDANLLTVTVVAALDDADDTSALRTLTRLHGVKERVGSAILAVYRPHRYTVMDQRAYKTLVALKELPDLRGTSWLGTWAPYLNACRRIEQRSGCGLRTIDRALFTANGRTELPAD